MEDRRELARHCHDRALHARTLGDPQAQIVLDTLEGLKMTYPKTSQKRRQELLAIRKRLAK
jgi:hypothetical protein